MPLKSGTLALTETAANHLQQLWCSQILFTFVCCLREDHCVRSPFSAGPAGIGLHFSPAARSTPKPPGRFPTHLYQVSKMDINNATPVLNWFYKNEKHFLCESTQKTGLYPVKHKKLKTLLTHCNIVNSIEDVSVHTLMSCRKILPPLLFCRLISFSACSRSSLDCAWKNFTKFGRNLSSLSK